MKNITPEGLFFKSIRNSMRKELVNYQRGNLLLLASPDAKTAIMFARYIARKHMPEFRKAISNAFNDALQDSVLVLSAEKSFLVHSGRRYPLIPYIS